MRYSQERKQTVLAKLAPPHRRTVREVAAQEGITEGGACTFPCARKFIDNDISLMIANSDQWVKTSIDNYLNAWDIKECSGHIMAIKSNHPKWSYIKFDESGAVSDVVEEFVISGQATVGIYNFSSGSLFCKYAEKMIEENYRSMGGFYVAPI